MPDQGRQGRLWRFACVIAAAFALAQCASSRDEEGFRVGESENALVVLGVAEAADATQADYAVLWRRVDPETRAFTDLGGGRSIELQTNSGSTVRVPGLPGEFAVFEVEPGAYALDGVFATIEDGRVVYIAEGLITGEERPGFDVVAGEAVYLGIWEATLDGHHASVRPWRLNEADMQAVLRAADLDLDQMRLQETDVRAVTCAPRFVSSFSRRRIC